jgi:hypothetical protein
LEVHIEVPNARTPAGLRSLVVDLPAVYLTDAWTEVLLPLKRTPIPPVVVPLSEPPLLSDSRVEPCATVAYESLQVDGVSLLPGTREVWYGDSRLLEESSMKKMVARLALYPTILPKPATGQDEAADWRVAVDAHLLDGNGQLIPARRMDLRLLPDDLAIANGAMPFELHFEFPPDREEPATLRLRIPARGRVISSRLTFGDIPVLGLHGPFGEGVWVNARGEFYRGKGMEAEIWSNIRKELLGKGLSVAPE